MKIKIKYHGVDKVAKLKQGDWLDLKAAETVHMKQGEYALIPLGVSMKLPKGYEAHVVPRSSTFGKYSITMANGIGIIDNSYSGTDDVWHFPAIAHKDTCILKGERICQFRIIKRMGNVKLVEVEELDDVCRGGFGSTGRR